MSVISMIHISYLVPSPAQSSRQQRDDSRHSVQAKH